jgi:hypothetical protein
LIALVTFPDIHWYSANLMSGLLLLSVLLVLLPLEWWPPLGLEPLPLPLELGGGLLTANWSLAQPTVIVWILPSGQVKVCCWGTFWTQIPLAGIGVLSGHKLAGCCAATVALVQKIWG